MENRNAYQGDGTIETGRKIIAQLEKEGGVNKWGLVGQAKHLVWYIDADGSIDFAVPYHEVLSGYTLKELPSTETKEFDENDMAKNIQSITLNTYKDIEAWLSIPDLRQENESLKAEREKIDLLLKQMVEFGKNRPESANYSYTDSAMCAAQLYQFISDAQTILNKKP